MAPFPVVRGCRIVSSAVTGRMRGSPRKLEDANAGSGLPAVFRAPSNVWGTNNSGDCKTANAPSADDNKSQQRRLADIDPTAGHTAISCATCFFSTRRLPRPVSTTTSPIRPDQIHQWMPKQVHGTHCASRCSSSIRCTICSCRFPTLIPQRESCS